MRSAKEALVVQLVSLVLGAIVVDGCASTTNETPARTTLYASKDGARTDVRSARVSTDSTTADSSCPARAASGALRRPSLEKTLDKGLGEWLRGVDIEPFVVGGRFTGWLVRSVYPDDPCYRDLDLQNGDVVTRVNGRSIERPEQAHEIWLALRRANALVIDYKRGSLQRRIEIPIVER